MLSELSLKVIFKQFKSDKTMLCKHTRSLSLTTTYSNCNIKDSLLQKHNKNHATLALFLNHKTTKFEPTRPFLEYLQTELTCRLRPDRILFISRCPIGIFLWYLPKAEFNSFCCCCYFCYRKTEQHGIWQWLASHCIIIK